ncbi:bifunctional biotin--[acetyl-CoA-carboxylase] ligase/biotin operon repressor BirA [Methylomicrobium sp. Wu6]|uniref:bifunctional biotin--[acetyl-CoA-carboxylase] ligase/biotin operon repressor BirA n=1 Tax=Methylomicrobium sp. Wu6 TaxID=3107928 RepID=UPI002DD6B615|nr:bifunctional biotin--[acetyl-CoA-carboxylase] ligase/biotin operon repressor BirA [Methylomicrobium sp. Wu6]MEC4750148.1 bifunctional biotin--[acetyl-CoA-carboxylase] ligase/biotin operon repressor BirA [Methylomicrobium sp. Wu6]
MLISDSQKKILALLADGEFHSGAELATALGVSRSAVWKQLNGLELLGVRHAAVSGKGYRLSRPIELLDSAKILGHLDDKSRAKISRLEIHDQIDSTNTYLSSLARQNAPSGHVCLAERQIAGKGRRGRQWVSPYGSNILLSILWRFQHGPAAISALSLAIGVAVVRALRCHGIVNAGLKWPNDIYSEGKKLGGILIEVAGENEGPCYAVTGIGLNLFLPEEEAVAIEQPWTDLCRIVGGQHIGRNQLAGELIGQLLAVLAEFEQTGLSAYLDEWRDYDCLRGEWASVFIGAQQFDGTLEGIDAQGFLLLRDAEQKLRAFASGEVSFRRTFP